MNVGTAVVSCFLLFMLLRFVVIFGITDRRPERKKAPLSSVAVWSRLPLVRHHRARWSVHELLACSCVRVSGVRRAKPQTARKKHTQKRKITKTQKHLTALSLVYPGLPSLKFAGRQGKLARSTTHAPKKHAMQI
ncbi:unnamed protein product [Ectocarpus sp. 12 AP-2014]